MEAFGGLATVLVIAGIVEKVVERIRAAVPAISGTVTNIVAWATGIAIAFGFDIAVFDVLTDGTTQIADFFDHILTGFGIGSGAGFFADWINRYQFTEIEAEITADDE